MFRWLRSHKFEAHLLAFILMIVPPIGLYSAAQAGAAGLVWGLLGLCGAGALVAVVVK